jgi:hypothetical protein
MGTLETVSVAEVTLLVPPGPLQLNEYVVLALTAPVDCVPLSGNAPLQPSDAKHAAALLEPQVSMDVSPGAITDGLTINVAVGTTLTTAVADEVPPGPLQANENVAADATGPVPWLPLRPTEPPHAPAAVHDEAFTEVHVKVAAPPLTTAAGAAVKVIVGKGMMLTAVTAGALLPPTPVQISEYAVSAVSAPVL